MNNKIPLNKNMLNDNEEILKILSKLINKEFILTGKTRTDGANLRTLVFNTLINNKKYSLLDNDDYEILTDKGKGIPRILPEFLDTYIITNNKNYNMQVWNRIPDSDMPLIKYKNSGEVLTCKDVRYLMVKVDKNIITEILLLTPDYIVNHFGKFGVPTIKHQLIINQAKRDEILKKDIPILFENNERMHFNNINDICIMSTDSIHDTPKIEKIIKIDDIYDIIKNEIIGIELKSNSTKLKGQELERIVSEKIGYKILAEDLLVGGYPDLPSQLLEVKVQESPTVDLGKYSPQIPEVIFPTMDVTTEDIRYLIALTDSMNKICGAILCPGKYLGNYFTYVANKSYKCQRGIPAYFFNYFIGKALFNPEYNIKDDNE